jgi:hypothetical protein
MGQTIVVRTDYTTGELDRIATALFGHAHAQESGYTNPLNLRNSSITMSTLA